MPGFNTLPVSSGGGGVPNMSFVGAIHMSTFNRSWAQGGTSGMYAVYSSNQESGYAYFVGATTTGVPMNRVANITHSFTRIDIVAPAGDVVNLYKVKVKNSTLFNNPFASFQAIPAILTASGNFTLPSNAMPIGNVLIAGGGGSAGGGHGDSHGGGGGGGGGNVIKLTEISIAGTTGVSIGAGGASGPSHHRGGSGGASYFGAVYALGGGGGGAWQDKRGYGVNYGNLLVGNGGGAGAGDNTSHSGGTGTTQTSSTGLGTIGSPVFHGGNSGGAGDPGNSTGARGGGGGGAGGNGQSASGSNNSSGGNGGAGHISDITGANVTYGPGGFGSTPNGSTGSGWSVPAYAGGGQGTTNGHSGSSPIGRPGENGVVIVRLYVP